MSGDTGQRSEVAGRLIAGRYRLTSPIGRGGMGAVWRATDELLDREVAVKELYIPGGLPDEDRAELAERSLREARAAARLRHRSVITVHDVVKDGDQPCIVMEFVPSRSLEEVRAADGRLPAGRVAQIGLAVLGALRTAHAAGVLHRDVKPSNVLLAEDGRVVLTDFGIARLEGDSRLTLTGRIMGSAGYIAPELARGLQAAGPAADLWSLGATLYSAVEGRQPYERDSFLAQLTAAATEDPEPLLHAGPLESVIAGLMARDPGDRMDAATAERMLAAVARTAEAEPDRATTVPSGHPAPAPGTSTPSRAAASSLTASSSPTAAPSHPGTERSWSGPAETEQRPAARPDGAPPPRRRRSRLMVTMIVGSVLLVPLAVAAGTLIAFRTADTEKPSTVTQAGGPTVPGSAPTSATPTAPTATPSRSTPSPTRSAPTEAAAGPYDIRTTRYQDQQRGFSVLVPEGWERKTGPGYVVFSQPGQGARSDFLVSLDEDPSARGDARLDPKGTLAEAESQFIANSKPVDYRRIRLVDVDSSIVSAAAEWEFGYVRFTDEGAGVRARVLERALAVRPGETYIMRWRVPASQWRASQKLQQTLFSSFTPPAG